jgi:hypothetical protein
MSLPLIAKHLEEHGRGEDTHLVHMTTGELKALQKLAEKHGGSLTINPHTGLPEAGFLSAILPAVAGIATAAFAPELLPLVAGGVGLADYAMTGSLSQGLMAGLGAWGGGSLASGIEGLGADSLIQSGGNAGTAAFNAAQSQAMDVAQGPISDSQLANIAQNQVSNTAGLTAEQSAALNSNAAFNPAGTAQAAGQLGANAQAAANPFSTMQTGLTSGNLGNYAMSHLGQVAAVGVPLLSGATSLFKQPTIPTATNTSTNPFGMKTIPKDANGNPIFSPTLPTPPAHPYQATYPNYVQNPYNPMTAKHGGLMDIHKYSEGDIVSGYGDLQQGLSQLSPSGQLTDAQRQMIAAGQQGSANGVYQLNNTDYAASMPTALLKKYKIAVAKGLEPTGQLGAYNTKPAIQAAAEAAAQQDIAQNTQNTSAKEGGLMAFANGGGIQDGHLGSYSDGGRLLKGPGDGVSDGIPATIGGKQPARLADGEFVIPARIVSELGNGSTDAGAKRLYAMMDRIKAKRAKTKDIAADTKAYKYLPT